MKKIPRFLKNFFSPKELHGIDFQEVLDAMADPSIRKMWLFGAFEEMKRLNLEVDRRLLTGNTLNITDLAARRKAYQDVLEGILTAKRQVRSHNPKPKGEFDLDSVTVSPVYL